MFLRQHSCLGTAVLRGEACAQAWVVNKHISSHPIPRPWVFMDLPLSVIFLFVFQEHSLCCWTWTREEVSLGLLSPSSYRPVPCEGQECPRGSCQNTWAQRRGVLTAAHSVTMVGGTSASPQNACPTRTWFTRRVSADVIEVKMEMSSCGMRKDPKSIENSYKRQKRRHRDTGQEEDHLRWR